MEVPLLTGTRIIELTLNPGWVLILKFPVTENTTILPSLFDIEIKTIIFDLGKFQELPISLFELLKVLLPKGLYRRLLTLIYPPNWLIF